MKLRANIKNDFSHYPSGHHSIEAESIGTTPDALTRPNKTQISESLNYNQAAYNSGIQSKPTQEPRSGFLSGVYQDRSTVEQKASPTYRPAKKFALPPPTLSFAQVPTKKAVPYRGIDKKVSSPEKRQESEWHQITRLDTIGSLDETMKSKP